MDKRTNIKWNTLGLESSSTEATGDVGKIQEPTERP
jgi:hypothetical protein